MQAHQCDLRPLIVIVGIGHQRRMIEKLTQRLSAISRIARRIHQLLEIFNSGKGFGSSLFFQTLDVSRAVDEELDNLRQRGRATSCAEAFDRRLVRASGWLALICW